MKTPPIVPQLEKFAQKNNITLELGWKVELSKKVKKKFESKVSDELEEKWKGLFDKLR